MLPHLVSHVLHGLDIFARGGGGGSGSGGDGGGSIFILLGYMPTHAWGAWLRKRLQDPMLIIGCTVGTVVMVGFWLLFAIGGLGFWGVVLAALALAGGIGGYRGWGEKYLRKIGKAKKQLAQAAQADPAWDVAALQQQVQNTFMTFQRDWSTFNIENMRLYLTARYWQHMALVMAAIKQRGRRNDVQSPSLKSEPQPIEVQDFANNNQDRVTFLINGQAHDLLLDTRSGQEAVLFTDNSIFTESWSFVRGESGWLLDGIAQATESAAMLRPDIEDFAQKNNMFYSRDWGWLLLPQRGVLFSNGRFGRSDINNHVIGVYKNLIIEIYTYIPDARQNTTSSQQFVIAQVALPKYYDSIIVEAKQGSLVSLFQRKPGGYNKLSLEWNDFNKRYNVYATNTEQVTAFELLHPVYMEKLFALPFKVSIEVVDNVVYLYTQDKKADYASMLAILQAAFEEMKL